MTNRQTKGFNHRESFGGESVQLHYDFKYFKINGASALQLFLRGDFEPGFSTLQIPRNVIELFFRIAF
jgi:hypothetical protein